MTQQSPIDAAALMQAAAARLAKGEAVAALELIERVIGAGKADASVWLALAHARERLGDKDGTLAAIDQALALEPSELRALLAKADHLDAEGDSRGASAFYTAALHYLPRIAQLPPHLQEGLRRAQIANQRLAHELEEFVRSSLAAIGLGPGGGPRRLSDAVDILFGRKRVYVQEPQYLYFPELPQKQFYERNDFPWLDAVEAAVDDIRAELQGVIGADFQPYLTQTPGRPVRAQAGLIDNPSWSAFFLYRDGAEQPGAARCPRTMQALSGAPLSGIPGRTPSILFSKLAAGAHIPAHQGMLNARLICHLPLIVPAGCSFRVGNDVRVWEEGNAWVFDDTIDHEAWNRSREDRYILLFDIWRPELSVEERAGVATLCEAVDAYGGKQKWDA
ncbi:MAG: aspartyl/asparaginyl beta-hydroxylase domain-containing protein [Terricaulis sp.]